MGARPKVMTELEVRLTAQTAALKKQLAKAKQDVKGFSKGVKQAGQAIKGAFAAGALLEFGKSIVRNIEKFTKLNETIKSLTGLAGGAVDVVSGRVSAMSDMFGESFEGITVAANNLSKTMQISFSEALDVIEDGFLTGANASGELLNNVKEYPTFLKEAGYNAREFVGLINRQTKQGIFSDKGLDSIKEATIRLREMPTATEDALASVGLSGKKISESIENGTLSVKQAIEIVSSKVAELPEDSKKVGVLLADVFGGAGEDAGVKWVGGLSKGITDADKMMLTQAQETKKELLKAQSELGTQWSRIFGAQSEAWQSVKKWVVKGTSGLLKWVRAGLGGAAGVAQVMAEDVADDFMNNLPSSLEEEAESNKDKLQESGKKIGTEVAKGIDLGIDEVVKKSVPDALSGIGGKGEAKSLGGVKQPDQMLATGDEMTAYSEKYNEESQKRVEQTEREMSAFTALSDVVSGSVGGAFQGLADIVAASLSDGQNILQSFGEFFKKWAVGLITKLVAMIATALVLTAVLSALGVGGFGGLKAAGEGLKFGQALGKNLTALGGFANGGVSSGGIYTVGERGKEAVALPKGSRVMSSPETKSAMSGSQSIHITGEFKAAGEDLNFVIDEYKRKQENTL